MKEAQEFSRELSAIHKYLTSVKDALQAGAMPDMRGLDVRVATLCQNLHQAEPSVQKETIPSLKILVETLDACERDLHATYATRQLSE